MFALIIGLILFLGVHSVRIFSDDWRTAQINRYGEHPWKIGYTLVSLAGFALIVWGYGLARYSPVLLWSPPIAMRHVAALLTAVSFILIAATYIPRNGIKARLHHPMVLGVKAWALAHLLANGTLADLILFGSFLVWAIFSFSAARKRDRLTHKQYPAGTAGATGLTVIIGIAAWIIFSFWLHGPLIGVRPFA